MRRKCVAFSGSFEFIDSFPTVCWLFFGEFWKGIYHTELIYAKNFCYKCSKRQRLVLKYLIKWPTTDKFFFIELDQKRQHSGSLFGPEAVVVSLAHPHPVE